MSRRRPLAPVPCALLAVLVAATGLARASEPLPAAAPAPPPGMVAIDSAEVPPPPPHAVYVPPPVVVPAPVFLPAPPPGPRADRAQARLVTGKVFLIAAAVNAAIVAAGLVMQFIPPIRGEFCGMLGCTHHFVGMLALAGATFQSLLSLAVGIPLHVAGKREARRVVEAPRLTVAPIFSPSGPSGGTAQLTLTF